jgi:hypothetical protein
MKKITPLMTAVGKIEVNGKTFKASNAQEPVGVALVDSVWVQLVLINGNWEIKGEQK